MASISESHNSVCPGFCPDLGTAGSPVVEKVDPPGALRLGLKDLPCEKVQVRFMGKGEEWPHPQAIPLSH